MPAPTCPICDKPLPPAPAGKPEAAPAHAPFCSRGCRDRDLLQWLGEGYRVPGPPADEEGLDKAPDPY